MEIIRATTTAGGAGEDVRSASAGQWTMDNGQWTMDNGQWTTLEVEFDEHDTRETKYIVAVDEYLPIATCRLYSINDARVMLGRIVVLPEYRRQGIGTQVVKEAEAWARELGFATAVVESRDNKIPFYESMGYVADLNRKIEGETFTCFRMEKDRTEVKTYLYVWFHEQGIRFNSLTS